MNVNDIINQGINAIREVLTPEKIQEYGLNGLQVRELIEKLGDIEEYLTPEIIKACQMPSWMVKELIIKTNNIEKYLTAEILEYGLHSFEIVELIIKTGKIDKYLEQPELLSEMGLNSSDISNLIKAKIKELPEEEQSRYLFEGQNINSSLNMSNVVRAMGDKEIDIFLEDEERMTRYEVGHNDIFNLVCSVEDSEKYMNRYLLNKNNTANSLRLYVCICISVGRVTPKNLKMPTSI